jgi:L-malate glycosyltransferase
LASRSLRVIHVTSATEMIYGAVHSMMTLANVQKDRGHEVSFVTFKGKPFGRDVRALGWHTREIRVRTKIDPWAIVKMRKHFRLQKASVIQTHLSTSSINGCLAARFAKIPCVGTVHGMSGKLSFVFADHLIGVSKGVKAHLVGQGVKESKVTAVYNGVDLPQNLPSKPQVRAEYGIPVDHLVLGTVARLTPLKGVHTVLSAFHMIQEEVPNSSLLLVGDGPAKAELQEAVRDLGMSDHVHFLGYQSQVFHPLTAMDLFLFGSQKEALGMAVVEALVAGLPVISTNAGGLPEVVTADVGHLVEVGDHQTMAKEALDLYQEGNIQNLSARARDRAKTYFSVQSMYEGTQGVYDSLLLK